MPSTLANFRANKTRQEQLMALHENGYCKTTLSRSFVDFFGLPHKWLGNELYCPVWVAGLNDAYNQDVAKLRGELERAAGSKELQLVIAGEMRLDPAWCQLYRVIDYFIELTKNSLEDDLR